MTVVVVDKACLNDTSVDMAVKAAQKLFEEHHLQKETIEFPLRHPHVVLSNELFNDEYNSLFEKKIINIKNQYCIGLLLKLLSRFE